MHAVYTIYRGRRNRLSFNSFAKQRLNINNLNNRCKQSDIADDICKMDDCKNIRSTDGRMDGNSSNTRRHRLRRLEFIWRQVYQGSCRLTNTRFFIYDFMSNLQCEYVYATIRYVNRAYKYNYAMHCYGALNNVRPIHAHTHYIGLYR